VIVDTSAIVAIILEEDEGSRFELDLAAASSVTISAATLVEATMVLQGRAGEVAAKEFENMLGRLDVAISPVTERTARLAQEGWRRFGKGRHRAALNFGDCFAYALAMDRDEPLLFKGDDFARTDVKRAL
jgi:ribonuclease VapC